MEENTTRFKIEYQMVHGVLTRKCRTCREYKSLNEENFIRRKTENGWRGECKLCYNKTIRNKQETNNTEKARTLKYNKNRKTNSPFKFLLSTAKGNAKRKFRDFDISEEYLIELFEKQNGKCFYTGRSLNRVIGFDDSISIDRLDSSLGVH